MRFSIDDRGSAILRAGALYGIRAAILLGAACTLAAPSAHAGSPLTLSILQDGSVTVQQLDVVYVREVRCEKPDLPPEVKIVKEKGTLELGGQPAFYISEFSLETPSQHVCFMPAHEVTVSTGIEQGATQTVPAQTWTQTGQRLDIGRITATLGKTPARVDASCLGRGKLDTAADLKILELRELGTPSTKSAATKAAEKGAAKPEFLIDCQVTP